MFPDVAHKANLSSVLAAVGLGMVTAHQPSDVAAGAVTQQTWEAAWSLRGSSPGDQMKPLSPYSRLQAKSPFLHHFLDQTGLNCPFLRLI